MNFSRCMLCISYLHHKLRRRKISSRFSCSILCCAFSICLSALLLSGSIFFSPRCSFPSFSAFFKHHLSLFSRCPIFYIIKKWGSKISDFCCPIFHSLDYYISAPQKFPIFYYI